MRLTFLLICLITSSCKLVIPDTDLTQFTPTPTTSPVQSGIIDKVTGMVDSRSQPGNLWVIQGEGSSSALTLIGHDGTWKGRVNVPRFGNRDWSDLAIGPGPTEGVNYLYIGEIGDPNLQNEISQIYRLPEPGSLQSTISQIERINFRYPDFPQDAKAFIVDPQTKDIFIFTNRNPNVQIYRLPYPQNINEITVAQSLGELVVGLTVTGANISTDGTEVLIRNYGQAFYWKRRANQTIDDLIQRTVGRNTPMASEAKGEAICFDKDGNGYFTLSQRNSPAPVNLYYFKKLTR
jgi:hypothetical protein